ncbi:RHS repeat domain-containing protein, partial [Candidatus Electrothrix sp.]|uniref:RHS repeat domain-containing protein n=1 Tax=Candidatus Electrothrix sp. TaxID=2170559 RepID=UPI0040560ED0
GYSVNDLNQYTSVDTNGSAASPAYDEDGSLTDDGTFSYTWNGENRLSAVTPNSPAVGDNKLEFLYDYMGRRARKITTAWDGAAWQTDETRFFVYDGWNLIEELDGAGAVAASYVYGLDLSQSLQGAGGIGGILARVDHGADKVHLYFYDANGNVGQLIDTADGSVVAAYEYAPFGGLTSAMGSYAGINPFRFSSKYADDEIGLYYYGYRYYLPELGRWLSRDPIGEDGGLNLYVFVGNDGVNRFDLLGKKDYWIGGGGDKYSLLGFGPTNLMRKLVIGPYGKSFPLKDVYGGYEEVADIVTDIEQRYKEKPCEPINLIGHSYGGAAAIDIAAKLKSKKIKVNVLITLDPVAAIPRSNPDNYEIWVNVYQDQTLVDIVATIPLVGQALGSIGSLLAMPFERHDISDSIATTGSQLGSQSGAINIERGYHHGEAHKFFLDALKKIPTEIRQRTVMPSNK